MASAFRSRAARRRRAPGPARMSDARRKFFVRAAVVATPLVAFVLYAALNWFVIEEGTQWVRMKEEAIKDPYLAYTRLLDRMKVPHASTDKPSQLDAPPEKGTVFLASRRLIYMSASRISHITSWVERGGTLVVEAEPTGID